MANRKRHILIIDDNEDIVNMMRLMLQMKNYDVSAQMSVTGLEETLNKTWPDLIIMDMLLSGADGRVVCRFLKRQRPLQPHTGAHDLSPSERKKNA